MPESIKKFLSSAKEKWQSFAKKTKILVVVIPVGVITFAIIATILINRPTQSVLFSGVSSEEATLIVQAVNDIGVTDITIAQNGDILVPKEQEESLRREMNILGYPITGFNYDIWDNGVNMFSTDFEKREKQRQQLESRIAATLQNFSSVKRAYVTLSIPESKDYVLKDDVKKATASVTLEFLPGKSLTNQEILGVYNTVLKSESTLTVDGISVVDSNGTPLIYKEEADDPESGVNTDYSRLTFTQKFENKVAENIGKVLAPLFGENGYRAAVNAKLNYDKEVSETDEYTPSVGEDGMKENETHTNAGGGKIVEGGVVGVTPNGDGSPDYPTIEFDPDGNFYYENSHTTNYLVNHEKTQREKSGYALESLRVSVAVDESNLTQGEKDDLINLVANAAGTTPEYVSFINRNFIVSDGKSVGPPIGTSNDIGEKLLIYISIGVVALLIILLIVSLFTGSTRKKRKRKPNARAAVASAPVPDELIMQQEVSGPLKPEFNIASLNDAITQDSKETLLKREIGDFAKTNPDIAASLIKNWLRDEDE